MQTYHTRPMPQGWTTQLDVAKLATREARFEADVPLAELAAMPQLAGVAGLAPAKAALVAEELLLSLPSVPLHDAPCAPAALTAVEVEPTAATVRPFKDLRALLKGE